MANEISASPDIDFSQTGGGAGFIEFVATQDILAYQPVTSKGEVGDSNDTFQINEVIGLALEDVLTGFTGVASQNGSTIVNPLWSWVVGDIIYLNGTSISTTAPSAGYTQVIGTALDSVTILQLLGIPVRF